MAIVLEKTYGIPVIVNHRTTFQGDISTVETPDDTESVIVNGPHSSCTCQEQRCEHISTVQRARAIAAKQNVRRAVSTTLFDLSYGDNESS